MALASFLLWAPRPVFGQTVRPGDERPPLKEFAPEPPEPSLALPPMPVPPPDERDRLATGIRVFVTEFRIVGSSVFSGQELAQVTAPYTGREITSEELIEVRDAITKHYIAHGYVSSGAIIPDQAVGDGVIEIQVVEGMLTAVSVEGTKHFRPRYLRERLELAMGRPVNIQDLEQRLQLIQQDSRIRRLRAQLGPGEVRGESLLGVAVEEESPYKLSFYAGNDQSPSIGSEGGQVRAAHENLTGNGDIFEAYFALTEGLDEWDVRYSLPVTPYDTILELHFRRSESDVVESPFDDLDLESESITYGVGVRHPVYRTPGAELWVGVTGELRRSQTFLLGDGFAFPGSGADEDGKSKLSVLRVFQEWTLRGRNDVIAARSTLNFGLDIFDASDDRVESSDPDGTFFSWLGQFQWAHRLSERYRGSQVIFRTDIQLSRDPLLAIEKFSVGGARTVRGYRENERVRDNGLVSSLEVRIPILRDPLGQDILQLAPFADFGRSWNEEKTPSPKTLSSLGVGLRWKVSDRVFVAGYWGGRLRKVKRRGNDIQNNGFHLEAVITAF
jgi:hemolysin activation/secretion protein